VGKYFDEHQYFVGDTISHKQNDKICWKFEGPWPPDTAPDGFISLKSVTLEWLDQGLATCISSASLKWLFLDVTKLVI